MPRRAPIAARHGAKQQHSKAWAPGYDRLRPSAWKRGYDDDWRTVRRDYLMDHPFCEAQSKCRALPPSERLATEVHHRVPIEQRPDLRLDVDNLQALCHACHSEITARANGEGG